MAAFGSAQHHAEAHLYRASAPMPPPDLPVDLAEVRHALDRCQDPKVMILDGFLPVLGCVTCPNGVIGVHFINPALIRPTPDSFRPPPLVQEPMATDGCA